MGNMSSAIELEKSKELDLVVKWKADTMIQIKSVQGTES